MRILIQILIKPTFIATLQPPFHKVTSICIDPARKIRLIWQEIKESVSRTSQKFTATFNLKKFLFGSEFYFHVKKVTKNRTGRETLVKGPSANTGIKNVRQNTNGLPELALNHEIHYIKCLTQNLRRD